VPKLTRQDLRSLMLSDRQTLEILSLTHRGGVVKRLLAVFVRSAIALTGLALLSCAQNGSNDTGSHAGTAAAGQAGAPGSIACSYWVATTGDDGAPGTEAAPWRTLEHAVAVSGPGETMCVAGGSYPLAGGELSLDGCGADSGTLGLVSPGGDAVLQGGLTLEQGCSHVRIEGFRIEGFSVWGVTLLGGNVDIALSRLRISGGEAGIRMTVGDSGEVPQYGAVSDVVIDESVVRGSVYTAVDCTPGPCDRVTFRRLEIYGAGVDAGYAGDGLAVERGQEIRVEDCYIHDNGGDGIDLGSRDLGTRVPGIVVERNRVLRSGRNGIKLWSGGRLTNNLVVDSGSTAVVLEAGEFEVVNNTFASILTWDYLAVLGNIDTSYPVDLILYNNIFFNDDPRAGGTLAFFPATVTLDAGHNLYYNPYRETEVICADFVGGGRCFDASGINDGSWTAAAGTDEDGQYADPAFVSADGGDFHLAGSSPAIDAGSSQHSPATDLEGTARDAAPDIGAYERAGGATVRD